MSGDELAAEAQIVAANRRAVEVRAEAAMLVEAVEDRAYSVSLLMTYLHPQHMCTLLHCEQPTRSHWSHGVAYMPHSFLPHSMFSTLN